MRKAVLAVAATVMVALGAGAQDFGKGDWFVGANSSIHDWELGGEDALPATWLDVNAFGGRFLSDRLAVDAMAGFNFAKAKGSRGASAFIFGAGVRYYPVGNLFARLGYNGRTVKNGNPVSNLDVKIGYDWFVSKRVFFEPALYYEKNINKGGGDNVLGLSLGIGVRF